MNQFAKILEIDGRQALIVKETDEDNTITVVFEVDGELVEFRMENKTRAIQEKEFERLRRAEIIQIMEAMECCIKDELPERDSE